VEGLEGSRFAVITKVHHCMIDGVSGVDLIAMLMDPEAEAEALRAEQAGVSVAHPWLPRPSPTSLTLLADEAKRRVAMPIEVLRAGAAAVAHPNESAEALREGLESLREFLTPGLTGGVTTPLMSTSARIAASDWLRSNSPT